MLRHRVLNLMTHIDPGNVRIGIIQNSQQALIKMNGQPERLQMGELQ
jgi:hypothetical protein